MQQKPIPNRREPKILRIIGRLNIGGPARQACLLHQALRGKFDTVLIAGRLDQGEGDMSYALSSQEGVRWIHSMLRPVRLSSDLRAFVRIFSVLRMERPDIVHTHTAKAGALGRAAALLARIPVRIHTYHGNVFHGYFGPVKTRAWLIIERILNRFTTCVIAISDSQAEELVRKYKVVSREKLVVVRNGHDLSLFTSEVKQAQGRQLRRQLGFSDSHFVVVWAGRLAPIKNIDLLAEIVLKASRSPQLRFLIVGDGSDRERLEKMTKGCENVLLCGWRSDMAELWWAADAALVTSRNEGTPTALLEAMACGKPFVSTNVGGVIDLAVRPKPVVGDASIICAANGFLTSVDAESQLCCLEHLANHREVGHKMGAEGRRFALQYHSCSRLLDDIEKLYRNLLHSHTRARDPQLKPSLQPSN
jgi:glycosyltransferase involved in cell wall biosynthesis